MSTLKSARILAIESSCDETAAAVIEDGRYLLSSTVASQMDIHARYGGVYPEIASRQHVLSAVPVVEQALSLAHLALMDIDAIAVTRGPGLAGSLIIGMNLAKGIVLGTGLPLIGVNHLEGHIYSAWIHETDVTPYDEPDFPLVALLVSGGHTELILMEGHLNYRRLGGTLDDAAGEAFDKVGRLLGLDYPGGPSVQAAAEEGNPEAFSFPRSWLEGTWDFSFSGLKTAVMREVREIETRGTSLPTADLAASFQAAVVEVLVKKTSYAAREFGAKEILVAGGVSANNILRNSFLAQNNFKVHIPSISLCTDNAAMIAAAGYFRYINGHSDPLDIDVMPNWPLS